MTLSPSVAKILKEDEFERDLREEQERAERERREAEERLEMETEEERELREAEEKEQDVSIGELGEQELAGQEQEMEARVGDDGLSTQDEKFIRKVEQFGKQIDHLNSYLAIKKKQGTDYKIYSTDKDNPTLFPYIASARMFNDFLTFVNACFTMKADQEIPQDYFPKAIVDYIATEDEEAQSLKRELAGICEDARDFAERKYVDKNGFEVIVLAYEKTYDARYLTSKGRRQQAEAFNDILQFLKTGKQPKYEIDAARRSLQSMAVQVVSLPQKIAEERERFQENLDSNYFADQLKRKLRQKTAVLVGAPNEKIKEYMEGLPDELRNEIISIYEQEVIPKVKQEIKDVKAGKKGSLREATTQKRQEEIERLQEEIDNKEAKLKNLGKAKKEELQNDITQAREKLEQWRKKNLKKDKDGKIDPKKTQTYMRMQNKFDKLVTEKTSEIANLTRTLSQEVAELERSIQQDRKRLTDKKIKLSSRRKEVSRREGVSGTLAELNAMLDATNYNDQHLRILRVEMIEQYVAEELEEELEEIKNDFNEAEKKLVMQLGRFSKVEDEISEMKKASMQIKTVLEDVDRLAAMQMEGKSLSIPQRKNLSLGRETLRTFVGAEQSIRDIVEDTERLLSHYENMTEYLSEALASFSLGGEMMNTDELQEDLEEELSDSEKAKNKLRTRIDKEMKTLAKKMDKLQENLKLYEAE